MRAPPRKTERLTSRGSFLRHHRAKMNRDNTKSSKLTATQRQPREILSFRSKGRDTFTREEIGRPAATEAPLPTPRGHHQTTTTTKHQPSPQPARATVKSTEG